MIESKEDYNNFLIENVSSNLFVHLLLTNDKEHPVLSDPCALFIYNFETEKSYCISINHQDAKKIIVLNNLESDLKQLKSKIFVLDKKSFIQKMSLDSVFDLNLALYLKNNNIIEIANFETKCHGFLKQRYSSYSNINKVIPLMKHKEMLDNIFYKINKLVSNNIFNDFYYKQVNTIFIETLSKLEKNGIFVDKEKFKKHFNILTNGIVYSQYNLYTSTGRPSNRFGGVNYAALNKEDGSRDCFISRFNKDGFLCLMDFSSFHPRITCELTGYKIPIDTDIYQYFSNLFFGVDNKISEAKSLVFRLLYGGVEDKYYHLEYFQFLKRFIEDYWNNFKKNQFITTPILKRKISNKHITDPNPNKLFNYILQATEPEIVLPVLSEINSFLSDKNTKPIIYTYDSILFDFHNSEKKLMSNIKNIMTMNNKYPVKCYIGDSYGKMDQIFV